MKKYIYLLIILFLLPFSVKAKEEIVTLSSCVDGDTAKFITSKGVEIKARFLAIDTPETVHPTKGEQPYGKDASNYTCDRLTNANNIKLEYDNNSTEEDKYGRKLVWVFVDDYLLQNELVKNGLAEVAYLYGDYKYTPMLQDSEALAKVNKVGIWSDEEVNDTDTKEDKKLSLLEKILNAINNILDAIESILNKLLKIIDKL